MTWEAASAVAAAGANRNIRRPVAEDARRRTGSGNLLSTDVANLGGTIGIVNPCHPPHPQNHTLLARPAYSGRPEYELSAPMPGITFSSNRTINPYRAPGSWPRGLAGGTGEDRGQLVQVDVAAGDHADDRP